MDEDFLKRMPRAAFEQYTLQEEILKGNFGPSGEPFMTTQKLAAERMVSIVTAHNIMKSLQEAGYIELRGKKYYLCHDKVTRSMANKTRILGLILPKMNNEFYSSLADRITALAAENGYSVLTMTTSYEPEEERRIHALFKSMSLAGIIGCGPTVKENMSLYQNCEIPHVIVGHSVDCTNCTTVQVNSFSISQRVAGHLVDSGYKQFMYIGNRHLQLDSDPRYMGFKMGLIVRGFNLDFSDVVLVSHNDEDSKEAILHSISLHKGSVGVFCNNDLFSSMLYDVCRGCGKRIPEDVGVVGFDDLSIAKVLEPALSTVHYRLTTMADTALQQIFKQIDDPCMGSDNIFIEPTLIVRESSKPAE